MSAVLQLLAVTPIAVSGGEVARRQGRYDRLSPAGVRVLVENLGTGSEVPRSLESDDDITASERCLVARFQAADTSRIDALLPDCVLDPVVDLESSLFARPVYGILKLSTHFLLGQGLSIGAVARNGAIAHELDRKLESYGCVGASGLTAILGLSVEDISDDALWASASGEMLAASAADAVINGCSAVETHGGRPRGTVLVDPTATALQLLGLIARATRGTAVRE